MEVTPLINLQEILKKSEQEPITKMIVPQLRISLKNDHYMLPVGESGRNGGTCLLQSLTDQFAIVVKNVQKVLKFFKYFGWSN